MASTACIGKIYEFDLESVSSYVERVEFFFLVNEVSAAKHVPVLLSAMGGKTWNNLLAPAALQDKSLLQWASGGPERPFRAQTARCKFHQRGQAPGETVAVYLSEVRHWPHTASSTRTWAWCSETSSFVVWRALLTKIELSFAKAVDVALGREAAARNVRQLQETLPYTQEMNKVSVGEGTK